MLAGTSAKRWIRIRPAKGAGAVADWQLYRVEKRARLLSRLDRLQFRRVGSRPILDKLHNYLLEIEGEVLPKSPEAWAVRYTFKNWTALTRYSEDGDLEIDNNASAASQWAATTEHSSAATEVAGRRLC